MLEIVNLPKGYTALGESSYAASIVNRLTELGVSRYRLCKECDMTESHISRCLSGVSRFTTKTLEKSSQTT